MSSNSERGFSGVCCGVGLSWGENSGSVFCCNDVSVVMLSWNSSGGCGDGVRGDGASSRCSGGICCCFGCCWVCGGFCGSFRSEAVS